MALHSVGEISISYTSAKAEFKWKIPNFFYINSNADASWDSPTFHFLDAEWCLRLLNVYGDQDNWKGLYLVVKNPSSCYSVTFTLGIRHLRVPCQFGPETRTFDKNNTSHGSEKLFHRNGLKRDNQDLSLVIYCAASQSTQSTSTSCQTSFLNSTTILCRNFQDLLLSGRNSDLTIAVHGQEFKAHKLILETNSPVFAAMFEHDMTENKEKVINVEDCDPDIFQNFLQCIYAGRVENLSSVDKAIRLYMVSHKYTVTEIMEKCVQLMGEELSEDTVCDILTFADRYNETNLKKTAEEFLIRNINGIISTDNWSSLIAENSLLEKYS